MIPSKIKKNLAQQLIQISKEDAPVISVIHGNDYFLKKHTIEVLLKKFKKSGIDQSPKNIWDESVDKFLNSSQNLSFFSERQVLIHRNADIFKTDDWKNLSEQASLLAESENPLTYLILICNKKPPVAIARNKAIKSFSADAPYLSDMSYWIGVIEKNLQYTLAESQRRSLIDKVGNNLGLMFNEVQKLKLIYPDPATADIEKAVHKNSQQKVFDLIDYFFSGQAKPALGSFEHLSKEKDFFFQWIALMQRQISVLLLHHQGLKKGLRSGELASFTKTPVFFQGKYLNQAKAWSPLRLSRLASELVNLEYQAKQAQRLPLVMGAHLIIRHTAQKVL